MAISAAVFFAGGANGMSWALASVAAPAHCTASLGSIQNFGGYLGGALLVGRGQAARNQIFRTTTGTEAYVRRN